MSLLHFTPAHGWMNDPNGLIHWRGRHHLFYQYNPDSTRFENQHWGHASSCDLINWTEHAVALRPGNDGRTPYDVDGCWSGCAVELNGGVALLYTGVRSQDQLPCLARSVDKDLLAFEKEPRNPVITQLPMADVDVFRDHTVWREADAWRQVMGGSRAGVGTAFTYTSEDLKHWNAPQVFLDQGQVGLPAGPWECPDVFSFGEVTVMVVSVIVEDVGTQPEVWWVKGTLDHGRLRPAAHGEVDVGDRLYGTQSYWTPDGRRVMFGWIRTHHDPASHGAASLGAMSLPRQLSLSDGRLMVEPVDELKSARGPRMSFPLAADGETRLATRPLRAGELVIEEAAAENVRAITLSGPNGDMKLDPLLFPGPGGFTIYWDAGIVEVFRNGRAGVWTDLGLSDVESVAIDHRGSVIGSAFVWRLGRP